MNLVLNSDFRDYYDHWFSSRHSSNPVIFERRMDSGPSRKEAFDLMYSKHLTVPSYGTPSEIITREKLDDIDLELTDVVVYLDEKSHAGEDKIKVGIKEALDKYPNYLCSLFIPSITGPGSVSWRYLRVGRKQFWLEYSSLDDWRSNCGNVVIKLLSQEKDFVSEKQPSGFNKYPLFAIDFVRAGKSLYAIDFNVSPGLSGTPVQDILTGKEIVQEIIKFYKTS